ncbi:MAG: hypothetical protein ABIF71_13755 [Planctomycetota bacterium]
MSQPSPTRETKCPGCGGMLHYEPGTTTLHCEFCGASVAIAAPGVDAAVREFDLDAYIAGASQNPDTRAVAAIACKGCGATVTMPAGMATDFCPFCNSSLKNTAAQSEAALKPQYLLPFTLDDKKANASFGSWLKTLWFAPGDLKKYASANKLTGMYLPYWTFDAQARTAYTGQRGDDHETTETHSVTVNGKSETRTRKVKKTRWRSVAGSVGNVFDDVLVTATRSIPPAKLDQLEPWDLPKLVPFSEAFVQGFRSERYAVGLKEGVGIAKGKMEPVIRTAINRDIGGDHQRIDSMESAWRSWKFKHVLPPVWVSAYRYRDKVFQFVVNARTGEVQGDRPWSMVKIWPALPGGAAIAAGIMYLFQHLH